MKLGTRTREKVLFQNPDIKTIILNIQICVQHSPVVHFVQAYFKVIQSS